MTAITVPNLTPDLAKAGFQVVDTSEPLRLVLSSVAEEKRGKTHFGLGMPKPMGVITHDTGTLEIIRKLIREGKFRQQDVLAASFDTPDDSEDERPDQKEAQRLWQATKVAWKACLTNKTLRSLMWDTATEGWELCRLARFGKVAQIPPHLYGPVNAEFRSLVKSAYDRPGLNVLLVHKMKKEYKENKKTGKDAWTGEFERAGFGDVPYLVDANIQHFFHVEKQDDGTYVRRFGIKILDSRHNPECAQLELEDEACSFAWLAASLFPSTTPMDWE